MKNVASIEYETADKGVATIGKKGKIIAKVKGSVKITAIVAGVFLCEEKHNNYG